MLTGGLNFANIGSKEEALQKAAATNRAIQLQQMMDFHRQAALRQLKSAVPDAFRDDGFVPKQYKNLLTKMAGPGQVGAFPDLDRLIAQSKRVEGEFFAPQQAVIDAYRSKFGGMAVPGASGNVHPSSPSFAAKENLNIGAGRTGSMHNVFGELLGRNMEYLGLQQRLNEGLQSQILSGLQAAAGHRAQIQAALLGAGGTLANTGANALAQTYNGAFTPHNWLSGTGGSAPGGHVSSYYQGAENAPSPEYTSNVFNKFKKEPPEEKETTAAGGSTPPPAQNKRPSLQASDYRKAGSDIASQWKT